MREQREDVRRYTTRGITINSTYGRIGFEIEFWNGGFRNSTQNDDSTIVDALMGLALNQVSIAINALNKDIRAHQKIGRAQPNKESDPYVADKSMSAKKKTLRVELSFDISVSIPSPVLMTLSEEIFTALLSPMIHILDPKGVEATITELVEQLEALHVAQVLAHIHQHTH